MSTVRVGIIGYGYWGPNLTRNFYEIPSAELVAIADLNDGRLKQAASKYTKIVVAHNYQELFDLGLDAVVVSTPPATHHRIAKDCLEHNLHVLVEKPITLSTRDAEDLVDLADAKSLTLMVGHTFEYNSAIHVLKDYIDRGELGEIYYLDAARLNLGLFQRDSNVMWDLAPHDISILLYLMGKKPISVSAHGAPCVFEGIHDVAYINMMFPGNVPAYIHVSWLDPCKVRRITIVGSKKMAVFNDMEPEQKIKIYDKSVTGSHDYTNGSFGEFQCSYHTGDITIPSIRFSEPLRQECQHFIDCIVNHTQPRSSGREGLEVVRILEAAQHSLVNGQTHEALI